MNIPGWGTRDAFSPVTYSALPGRILLGLRVPGPLRAHSESFKELQTEADLVVEPAAEAEPVRLVEFQGYRDKQFVPKVMLRCALYRMQHPARAVRCHSIYLDREYESAAVDDGGLFQPHVHYLPEVFQQLTIQYPDSLLLSVLRPLLAESEQELLAAAGADYERIRQATALTDEQRRAWLEVFHCWLMTRLQMTLEEIRKMVTWLPDVEDTPWGRELKERWTAEMRAEYLRRMIQVAEENLKHYEEMLRMGLLSEAAHRDLTARAEKQVQQYRTDLAGIENTSE